MLNRIRMGLLITLYVSAAPIVGYLEYRLGLLMMGEGNFMLVTTIGSIPVVLTFILAILIKFRSVNEYVAWHTDIALKLLNWVIK